jgi:hypothetical protein
MNETSSILIVPFGHAKGQVGSARVLYVSVDAGIGHSYRSDSMGSRFAAFHAG